MYNNIEIILATKHEKEKAIQEPFEEEFNAKIIVPSDYDTDQFGTFTGEVPRLNSAYETVIKKAKEAALQYGFQYAIANEGSFGPHPTIFFAPADIELMSFVDYKNDMVVVESEITTETNYAHCDPTAAATYADFLEKIKFGSHGVIVRSLDTDTIIAKGITQREELDAIVTSSFKRQSAIRLETDMRAMMNPTRMNIINKLAIKLIQRLQKICHQCGAPGFGKTAVTGNLLCRSCRTKTELYQFKVLSCVKCDHQEYYPRADKLEYADQQYCPYCNP